MCDENNAIVAVTEIKLLCLKLLVSFGWDSLLTPNLALWLCCSEDKLLLALRLRVSGEKQKSQPWPKICEMSFKSLILRVQFGFNFSIHLEETRHKGWSVSRADGSCHPVSWWPLWDYLKLLPKVLKIIEFVIVMT